MSTDLILEMPQRDPETTTAEEQALLQDISQRTGLTFSRLWGIPAQQDEQIADLVLPILVEWVDFLSDPRVRAGLYTRFHTKRAAPYVKQVIAWWRKEKDPIAQDFLVSVLEKLADKFSAIDIWTAFQELHRPPVRLGLLRKLAGHPSISREVKATILHQLQSFTEEKVAELTIPQLLAIARMGDPEIEQWFASQGNSKNRRLARAVSRLKIPSQTTPSSISYSNGSPDQLPELTSFECDLIDLPAMLDQQAKTFRFKLPEQLLDLSFFETWEIHRWARFALESTKPRTLSIWFRVKEEDAIEVRVTNDL